MKNFVRACRVFYNLEKDIAVVAAVYNGAGSRGIPNGAARVAFSDADRLNAAIKTALENCLPLDGEVDLLNDFPNRVKDWAALKASGYRTAKQFGREFVNLHIRGANEMNHFYEITTPEFGKFLLHLSVVVSAYKYDFGEAIQYLSKAYKEMLNLESLEG